ncbi:pilin [Rhodanobacter sp. Col0626]|uniref:pilin n=1 Tax=Rhodanobacter sp. Col0626 TaxID=3415679 RepID=UPI003CE9A0FE
MEHLVRLAHSNSVLYAAVFVFTFGVILWFVWARFFPDRDAIKKTSQVVVTFALQMFFVCCYASVVAHGWDGVVCAAGRFSLHVVCYSHDEGPLWFWGLVVVLMSMYVVLILVALVFLVHLVAPGDQRPVAEMRNQHRSIGTGERRPGTRVIGRAADEAFVIAFGVIVISSLAWIATLFHQVNGAQKQIAEALASATRERAAVEAYLQDNGVLPEDDKAVGLLLPADLRSQYVNEVRVAKGSILLKFDEAAADKHLGGRLMMLIAVQRGRHVSWHCASPDIDDKYFPDSCPAGL